MFTHLQSLSTLLSAANVVAVDEAKTDVSDLDGIKSIVDDALGDLSDKLGKDGALAEFAKKTGMDKLDTEKDKDGLTVLPKLAKLVADFKKQVESLMTEVELMAVSSAPTTVKEDRMITEAKDYADSGEFTDELFSMSERIARMKQTVRQPRWGTWMKVTDDNFNTSCVALKRDFTAALGTLDKAFTALEDELHSAS